MKFIVTRQTGGMVSTARTDMYGNSVPAGSVGGDLFEYINFQQRYNIDARIASALRLSKEYLEPLPEAQIPRNSVDQHVQWLESKSNQSDVREAEYNFSPLLKLRRWVSPNLRGGVEITDKVTDLHPKVECRER